MKKKFSLKISSKILLYFLLVSLLPLYVTAAILVSSARNQLLQAATARQQTIASDTAAKVDSYLANKISAVLLLSQAFSTKDTSTAQISQSMALLIHYDPDISQFALLNSSGQETDVFNRQGQVSTLSDESGSDAYKAATFLSGKPFVSSVSYDSNGEPGITIAVPVLTSNFAQNLANLQHANFGTYANSSSIQGVLVANYNISQLWQSVLSTKIGKGGYAYIVDSLGNLVAHPDKKFFASNHKISNVAAVKDFINGNFATQNTVSETGLAVVSTPRKINNNNWAVIVEEPVSSIYAGLNSFIKESVYIFFGAVLLVLILGLLFRRQLIRPIKKLTVGAKQLGAGKFDYKIDIRSNDELRELADTFNVMSQDIEGLVNNLQTKNASLVTEQTKLNRIISSVNDGIIALDMKGRIISINPPAAALIKKQPNEVYGQIASSLFAWEHDNNHFMPEVTKPGLYQYTNIVLPRGADYLYLDLMVSVIDRKDSDVKAIISIHDQTKARELEFMKLDFVAIAAHELRTPLTVIQGYLALLNHDAVRQLTIYNIETLEKAVTGANQLRDLINKLLSISRIERGKLEINLDKLNITKLLSRIVDEQSSTASQKNQIVRFHTDIESPVYVLADSAAITEVVNNLIGNALKYTPEGGSVNVSIAIDKKEAKVTVSDNGPGIPSALRARLFTKFYRAERSMIAGSRGTGLGLYISKVMIELHKGKIGIAPDTGKGSTFFFTLPLFNESQQAQITAHKGPTGGAHGWFKKHPDR